MAKIAIIGAGSIGKALCKILLMCTDHIIQCIDISPSACEDLYDECNSLIRPVYQTMLYPEVPIKCNYIADKDDILQNLMAFKPEIIVCACHDVSYAAQIAKELNTHFIAFSEDHSEVLSIQETEVHKTFVMQTGLAPGLANYFAWSLLATEVSPKMLTIACSSLPEVSLGDVQFARTKNSESLLAEYLSPALILADGDEVYLDPMADIANLRVNGILYETFISGGGIGDPLAYDVPNVCFRSIRFPGHTAHMQSIIQDAADPVNELLNVLPKTSDDYVVLAVIIEDSSGNIKTTHVQFGSCPELDISAQALGASCTAAGIIELILEERMPVGYIGSDQVSFYDLDKTTPMKIFHQSIFG